MQNNDPEVLDAKIESLAVYSWSPDRLGVERPTQVHMIMQLDGLRPDGRPCIAALRFKGPDTIRQVIMALLEHSSGVWRAGGDDA